ncbi:MAG TPA: hypothetical protein PK416_08910, partial [Thermodesulfobacteriota bacterium]|nr:hypothetical protein [Thermodesulfobacteriota bacterium]
RSGAAGTVQGGGEMKSSMILSQGDKGQSPKVVACVFCKHFSAYWGRRDAGRCAFFNEDAVMLCYCKGYEAADSVKEVSKC